LADEQCHATVTVEEVRFDKVVKTGKPWFHSTREMIMQVDDQQNKEQCSEVRDQEIRAALDQHWAASDANDFETEHRIYHEDAVLEYPQSGERTRGRRNIQNQRASQPSKKRFTVRRVIGGGDLWVTEFILTYDGKPSYTVSIMEFSGDKVARETQYFADPFPAPAWRARWVERMDT
jgi:ketosteroid isomerase-like protein